MPNWCGNWLEVEGEEKELKKFKRDALPDSQEDKTELSLASLYPEPKDYSKVKVKPTFPEISKKPLEDDQKWWDWRVQNWGTKWDVMAELAHDSEDKICYLFDSAWSPPSVNFWTVVSKNYPKLWFHLEYEEGGCDFKGYTDAHNGRVNDHSGAWYPVYCDRCELEFTEDSDWEQSEDGENLCRGCLDKANDDHHPNPEKEMEKAEQLRDLKEGR